jgi:hypothetical protein
MRCWIVQVRRAFAGTKSNYDPRLILRAVQEDMQLGV